ncbi:unnamed protein product [Closterium sp. Yama58-4]|nr:unnamed protein product [Closterium sp. Yama58-4]
MQDVKPQQQDEQKIRQRPQEAKEVPVASAAAHPLELPVEADVDWQETAGRQVDAGVTGGIDEEETAGWQAALGAEEVRALLAGAGAGTTEGRKRMGGGGGISGGKGEGKGGVGLGGEGVEGEGKPLGIEGAAAVLVQAEGGEEGEGKGGVGLGGEGVEGEEKPLGIEGAAAVLVGGGGGEGEGGEVPLMPPMPGVLSMGGVLGGAEHMAASTWSGAKEAVASAAHNTADTAAAGTAAVGRAAAGMVGLDTNAPPIGIPLGSSSLPTATDEAQMGAAALVAGETAPAKDVQSGRTEQPSSH